MPQGKSKVAKYTKNLATLLWPEERCCCQVQPSRLNLIDFKEYTNKEYKPVRCKHFSRGSKIGNKLLTKIRVGRSDLNQHKHVIGLSDTPECLCHFRQESPLHYFIDCFLYLPERQTLFSLIEHNLQIFLNKTNLI